MASLSYHSLTLLVLISSFVKTNFLSITAFSNHRHVKRTFAFTSPSSSSSTTTARFSTPFDASLYDNLDDDDDDESNPFTSNLNPLAASPDTKLILGLNKYSHDTTLCAADAKTGEVLFAMAKERLSRKKHDGGNVASLVDTCLDQLELDLDSIQKVVMNNHHHRVLPMERNLGAMEWEEGLGINGGTEGGYTDEENLLSKAEKWEISHHLAHAYSAAAQCPFDTGLVVVMDGMGETYRTMRNAKDSDGEDRYVSDLDFEGDFECIPSDIKERSARSVYDWREGESAYEFTKNSNGISVKPIFKRFVEERTPPALYNHGFENMESAGALYSRASSHIFGDWNACGKVMGLAPWMGHIWTVDDEGETTTTITAEVKDSPIMKGKLYEEGENGFQTDPSYMMGIPHISRNDPDLFDENGDMIRKRRYDFDDNDTEEFEEEDNDGEDDDSDSTTTTTTKKKQLPTKVALDAISLSSRIQNDLESVVMDFVQYCKSKSNKQNLCLAGGVALNSVLNGRLSRELGFKNVFIPPYPGDDGIAVGCCAYGLYGNAASKKGRDDDDDDDDAEEEQKSIPTLWTKPLSPYLGPLYSDAMIKNAIDAAAPWLEVQTVTDDQKRLDIMAKEIESGGVIAWYQGRSELGPRALGHRSILADPRQKGLVRFINGSVKKRESFRPFAPSVLAEEAGNWFHLKGEETEDGLEDTTNISPYMSMTAIVKESKQSAIPAVTHVDGSSRLQTVTEEAEPLYHQFLSTFFKNTGVPMVLNTSFNTLPGEPIVETPKDAIRSFLCSMGSIELLVMGDYVIQRKDANVRKLLGEAVNTKGLIIPPSFPKRAGPVEYESKFTIGDNDGDDSIQTRTRVRMPDRPMHNEKDGGWFELLDDLEGELLGVCDGSVGVSEITSQYLQAASEDEDDERTEEKEFQEALFSNIVRRLIRLYEHSLISW